MSPDGTTTHGEAAALDAADLAQILKLLPHRYPFLMIDRIVEMRGDEAAVGLKNVTVNEPHFQGHFPENPVMPGVLIVEAMAQTAGALVLHRRNADTGASLVYFMSIDKARFRKPVVPGDTLFIHVEKLRSRGQVWKYRCHAKVEGALVAEAEITAMIAEG